ILEKVYAEGEKKIAVLENEYTGQREERVVDQVVIENGTRPNEALYYELKANSINKGQIDVDALFACNAQPVLKDAEKGMILWRLGDCVSQRNTHAAIYDALRLCKDL
ncbi:MAG: N-methylproline demethylase, partial [Marinobacter sp.]|nr:N-methylproline demethylase [Marinobacter sp.]